MYGIILTIDIIAAIAIVALVLLQQGKGANMGVSFGAGASNTVFGSKGAASFLFKMTVFFTAVFFVCCLTLGYLGKSQNTTASVSSVSTDNSIASQYDQYQKEIDQSSTSTKK
ncbi:MULTISPECIES: preprotein translocase subunit SecG [Francisella]|uniref:Protein-export membrane protein SecG n=3 Tax=Francisella TaxID=262 RepID=A0AAW3D8R3_9GAMM|nr:preprotein translocase subunit SecG [Francisella philomiragia]AJI47966.1 preprotein translocase, SecG subunit [Francisella philomiragia]AJI49017.1 preprotein translocase, SecG subunit [Francisella philomiragia]AJI55128.1 preprotein translocase, SecG subunit [Francisella philomiragia]AJI57142.1 preprotein translocase, SecG subunit [Francisella philomiragia]AJI75456.1 preprotein translocase, SecG subunit [Francisella philomiragia subsp. philomiragia ATCC 25015]